MNAASLYQSVRIKEALRKSGLSLRKFAADNNVSASMVSRVIHQQRVMSFWVFHGIHNRYNKGAK